MPDIRARVMECSEAEEHILTLLGKAVVDLWHHLPEPVRDQLVERAELIHDGGKTPEIRRQIMAVVMQFRGDPFRGDPFRSDPS